MSIQDAQALSERLASQVLVEQPSAERLASQVLVEQPSAERRACNAAAIRAAGYGAHALAAEREAWEQAADRLTDALVELAVEAFGA